MKVNKDLNMNIDCHHGLQLIIIKVVFVLTQYIFCLFVSDTGIHILN